MRRDRRFELVLTDEELTTWREVAEAEGISLSAWMRRCCKETVDMLRAQARNDAILRRQSARIHGMDPSRAEELDFGRSWPPDEDPPIQGGSSS